VPDLLQSLCTPPGNQRAHYGEAIIGVIRNGNEYNTAFSTNFFSGTKGVKARVYALMDMKKKRFSPALLLTTAVVALFCMTGFALSPATPNADTDSISTNQISPPANADRDSETDIESIDANDTLPSAENAPRLMLIDEDVPDVSLDETGDKPQLILDEEN
jgi:hypothetical protein